MLQINYKNPPTRWQSGGIRLDSIQNTNHPKSSFLTRAINYFFSFFPHLCCSCGQNMDKLNGTLGLSQCSEKCLTSSLSRMRPRRGRDMDHWLRQSSNMMMLSTVDSICCRISGCTSRMRRKASLFIMRWDAFFFFLLVRQRKRKVMMLSSVAQQPVHTIVSGEKGYANIVTLAARLHDMPLHNAINSNTPASANSSTGMAHIVLLCRIYKTNY